MDKKSITVESGVVGKQQAGGFTTVELLVVVATLVIVAILLLPALSKTRYRQPRSIQCIRNLKEIGLAFRLFSSDHGDRFPMRVSAHEGGALELVREGNPLSQFLALSNRISKPKFFVCPLDKGRSAALTFGSMTRANLSYFVGLDASEEQPQSFLTGDRHLTVDGQQVKPGLVELATNMVAGWTAELHNQVGNVAMGDGSVQQFNDKRLAEALRGTGLATNRLAVP